MAAAKVHPALESKLELVLVHAKLLVIARVQSLSLKATAHLAHHLYPKDN
jgi:hypothetical protein